MGFAILLLVVIVMDIVALRWGFDSRDKIDSPEWERRKEFLLGYRSKEESLPEKVAMPRRLDVVTFSRRIEYLPECQNSY